MYTKGNLLVGERKSRGRRSRKLENTMRPDVLLMSLNSELINPEIILRLNLLLREIRHSPFVADVPGSVFCYFQLKVP